jgi:hypothetical protein
MIVGALGALEGAHRCNHTGWRPGHAAHITGFMGTKGLNWVINSMERGREESR